MDDLLGLLSRTTPRERLHAQKKTINDVMSLKVAGLAIVHELLRKLTHNAAKCDLLWVLIEPCEWHSRLYVTYNGWQEPRVVFRDCRTDPGPHGNSIATTPLAHLEADLHTYTGPYGALEKAFENLYVRLAKVIASPESSLLLKKRALHLWAVEVRPSRDYRHRSISIDTIRYIYIFARATMMRSIAAVSSSCTSPLPYCVKRVFCTFSRKFSLVTLRTFPRCMPKPPLT
jgi:hypothetical protein